MKRLIGDIKKLSGQEVWPRVVAVTLALAIFAYVVGDLIDRIPG